MYVKYGIMQFNMLNIYRVIIMNKMMMVVVEKGFIFQVLSKIMATLWVLYRKGTQNNAPFSSKIS